MHELFLLLAKNSAAAAATAEGKGMSFPVAIVLAGVIIGVAITLMPPKRSYEVKKPKDE
jgi:hypothetical protein